MSTTASPLEQQVVRKHELLAILRRGMAELLEIEDERIDVHAPLVELGAEGERVPALPTPGAMTLDEIERAMIERALRQFGGNLTRAAEALGVSRTALYRRLQKHGLEAR